MSARNQILNQVQGNNNYNHSRTINVGSVCNKNNNSNVTINMCCKHNEIPCDKNLSFTKTIIQSGVNVYTGCTFIGSHLMLNENDKEKSEHSSDYDHMNSHSLLPRSDYDHLNSHSLLPRSDYDHLNSHSLLPRSDFDHLNSHSLLPRSDFDHLHSHSESCRALPESSRATPKRILALSYYNDCYSDAVVECLLSLGTNFNNHIYHSERTDEFSEIFMKFLKVSGSETYKEKMFKLREYVEKCCITRGITMGYDKNEPQDAQEYFYHILNFCTSETFNSELFTYYYIFRVKCDTCQFTSGIIEYFGRNMASCNINQNGQLTIIDLDIDREHKIRYELQKSYHCKKTLRKLTVERTKILYGKYLVLTLTKPNQTKLNINPDKFELEDFVGNFRVKAAIVYHEKIKHYTCLRRNAQSTGWLHVDGATTKILPAHFNFNNNNFTMLFLEHCHE